MNLGVPNENYDADMIHTMRYTRLLLQTLGVWPMVKKKSRRMELRLSVIVILVCSTLMAFVIIPCLLHIIFREKNPLVRLMLFGPVGFCITTALKYLSIICRRDSIKSCFEHVSADWMTADCENDRRIMRRNVDTGRILTLLCGTFMYSGGISYHTVMPLFAGNTINEFNETVRPLVFPGCDIFVDPQASPTYEIIFLTQCIAACVSYAVVTATCNLAAMLVTHSCGQIQIMMSRLETLFDPVDDQSHEILKNRVGFVIRCHVRVLRFTTRVEEVLREICLVEVVASTLIICLLEYYCMTEWSNSDNVAIITYFVLLMALSFNIFIFCHIGELLKDQCYQIGKATYMIDWYRLPGKTGLALVMIIAASNRPRKLTAGRMMELSVSSFGAIIKTSFMYLNMLRTMSI